MPSFGACLSPGAVTCHLGSTFASRTTNAARIAVSPAPGRLRINWRKAESQPGRGGVSPLTVASASAASAGSFKGSEASQDEQKLQPSGMEDSRLGSSSRLGAVPQAALYALLAAATCLWWISNSNMAVGSAMFAAATVAAKPATMFLAAKSAWAGLMAGGLHTLAGPDHLAALTPLSIGRSRTAGALLGALWGAGHSAGQLILGLMMVLLKDRFHAWVPALEVWGSTFVGLTLIAIGAIGIRETFFSNDHDDHHHHHEEEEIAALVEKAKDSKTANFAFATFGTGIVHGLQPDALFVIIPALALPTKAAAAAYILMFVFGTCAAMGGYTALIGHTMSAISNRDPSITRKVAMAASGLAIVVGLLVLLPGWGIEIPWSPI